MWPFSCLGDFDLVLCIQWVIETVWYKQNYLSQNAITLKPNKTDSIWQCSVKRFEKILGYNFTSYFILCLHSLFSLRFPTQWILTLLFLFSNIIFFSYFCPLLFLFFLCLLRGFLDLVFQLSNITLNVSILLLDWRV